MINNSYDIAMLLLTFVGVLIAIKQLQVSSKIENRSKNIEYSVKDLKLKALDNIMKNAIKEEDLATTVSLLNIKFPEFKVSYEKKIK